MLFASLALTLALITHPLEVIVFDNTLQRVVGYGKQSGDQLRLELQEDYTGPVVSMIVHEKATSVPGMVVAGQLTLNTSNGPSTMAQYLDSLGINLKLTVVKTPKLDVKNVPDGNKGQDPDNKTNNPSNNSGSGSSNSGGNSGSGSSNSGGKGKNK
ncbi:hypothetical protein [Deinococcus misasensis]|uniref:hypothetical protein n=1 Tax=Deinococcus misasensis TaxID=392413 RepID=UPI0005537F65|nr:hypothetical protein [Deinococcus misasensis]